MLTFLVLVAFWVCLAAEAVAQGSVATDRAALEALYDATGGAGWTDNTNWKTAVPLGEWFGVTTDAAGRVTRLEVSGAGLTGRIPAALGDLALLQVLDLGFGWDSVSQQSVDNELTGPIPGELGNLTNLEVLNLAGNGLIGPIPASLGSLTGLQWLNLGGNTLTGPIPDELGNLANLESLNLDFNELTGPVPAWLGNLTGLRRLDLQWNALTGPIPAELGSLVDLQLLDLCFNTLTGPVPAWLGSLTGLKLLSLCSNDLTGPVPGALGNLANLESLYLWGNALTGPIPAELGNLANLQALYFQINPLTGSLPRSLTRLSKLMLLDIRHTAACAPADGGFQEWLAAIDFRGDTCNHPPEPVGTIPPQGLAESGPALGVSMEAWFSDPDDDPLTYAAASSNEGAVAAFASGNTVWLVPGVAGAATVTVTAQDPDGLSATQAMAVTTATSAGPQSDREVLEVLYDSTGGASWTNGRNWKTSAPLGEWYGVTTNPAGRVTELHLDENDLTGPIPAALGDMARLGALSLRRNGLVGSIPGELGSLVDLERLDLRGNELTGPIPAGLGNLTRLRRLYLDSNALTGPIPEELGSLVNLQSLDLGSNGLTGPIPDALGNLVSLRNLSLGLNDLTGPVSGVLGGLMNLVRLGLSYNWGLSGLLPPVERFPHLESADFLVTQACAPAGWRNRVATIEFDGRECATGAADTIDVAVFYTRAVREGAVSGPALEALIDLRIAETNQAFAASGMQQRLRLVERSEVAYDETGSSIVELDRLRDPSDGHMDEVHAVRDRVGADLVSLMVEDSDVCGRAELMGAFSLTRGGCAFTHELGHNLGLNHDRYEIEQRGLTTHGHPAYGYVNQRAFAADAARSRRWVTIMAYGIQCPEVYYVACSFVFRFSNPRQNYNGDPLGIPHGARGPSVARPADAIAVLNATGPVVALWRDRPPGANRRPTPVGTLPDRELTVHGTLTVDASFVDPDGDPLTYTVSSSAPEVVTVRAGGARVTLTAVDEGRATIRLTATDPGGLSAAQSFTVTVTAMRAPFTDDPIVPGVTPIKAVHFTELRMRIDALRSAAGLLRFSWTDPVLRAGVTRVRRVHLLELRAALVEAYRASGRSAPRWTDTSPAAGTTPIRAAHVTDLRAAVLALE